MSDVTREHAGELVCLHSPARLDPAIATAFGCIILLLIHRQFLFDEFPVARNISCSS